MTSDQEINKLVGKELGTSEWFQFTQEMVDQFADITHDHQWIHTDVEKAKQLMPDTGTIVHGFFTVSMISYLMGSVLKQNLPASHGSRIKRIINYGLNKLRYTDMVPVGSRVRVKVTLNKAEDTPKGRQMEYGVTMETEGRSKPALVTEAVVFYILA